MFIKRQGQRAGRSPEKLAYAHDSHRQFNEQLKARREPAAPAHDRNAPWMDSAVLARLPHAKQDFARTQHAPQQGSTMVRQDAPHLTPRPPRDIAKPVDRQNFNQRWLAEQRNAAFAQVKTLPSRAPLEPDHQPAFKTPSR